MKSIEVRCPECKGKYLADRKNTKFYGQYMKSECAHCASVYEGKFLTFILRQYYDANEDEVNRFECCKSMIALSQEMDKHLNPEPEKGTATK